MSKEKSFTTRMKTLFVAKLSCLWRSESLMGPNQVRWVVAELVSSHNHGLGACNYIITARWPSLSILLRSQSLGFLWNHGDPMNANDVEKHLRNHFLKNITAPAHFHMCQSHNLSINLCSLGSLFSTTAFSLKTPVHPDATVFLRKKPFTAF